MYITDEFFLLSFNLSAFQTATQVFPRMFMRKKLEAAEEMAENMFCSCFHSPLGHLRA